MTSYVKLYKGESGGRGGNIHLLGHTLSMPGEIERELRESAASGRREKIFRES